MALLNLRPTFEDKMNRYYFSTSSYTALTKLLPATSFRWKHSFCRSFLFSDPSLASNRVRDHLSKGGRAHPSRYFPPAQKESLWQEILDTLDRPPAAVQTRWSVNLR